MRLDPQQFDHDSLDFRQWSVEDLAWAAGFLDGDGCISCYLRGDKKQDIYIKVSAVSTRREMLDKLQLMFGGSVCAMHKENSSRNWKSSWIWTTTHRRAERVLLAVHAYLVGKHEQAVKAIEARNYVSHDRSRRSPETLEKLREIVASFRDMNRKGVYHELHL